MKKPQSFCYSNFIEDKMTKKLPNDSKVCKEDEQNGRNINIFVSNSDETPRESHTLNSPINSYSNNGILSLRKC